MMLHEGDGLRVGSCASELWLKVNDFDWNKPSWIGEISCGLNFKVILSKLGMLYDGVYYGEHSNFS